MKTKLLLFLFLTSFCLMGLNAQESMDETSVNTEAQTNNLKELVVLWTTAEKEVFTKMIGIYVYNAKKSAWFDEVTFIVWGPSSKLLAEDEEIQGWIEKFKEQGIILEACIWCSNQYGVTEDLKNMGIDVRGMGRSLSDYLNDANKKVISF